MSTSQRVVAASLGTSKTRDDPDHLLVLVHGILASPSDWNYAETDLKKQLGSKYLVYASSSNSFIKTFSGIDRAGMRLADEVMQVVKKINSLKKISFLAHSLGGLFARYAIGVLYSPSGSDASIEQDHSPQTVSSKLDLIAGLEPVSFVTLATPHLGVRGKRQLPLLLGIPVLEKLAPQLAPFLIGRTGCQLFLTDGKPTKPPLLLRMASDCEKHKFISALAAFKCRTLYANVSYDHLVGWRTSSIRRENELVKPPRQSLEGYKHVVDIEVCPPVLSEKSHFSTEAPKSKGAAWVEPSEKNTEQYHDIMEEEMIRGLQLVGWKKVDVSFHSAMWPFFAHNNIHVKSERLHNAGAGVIAHVVDSLKYQDSHTISANL